MGSFTTKLLSVLVGLALAASAFAVGPQVINYQGVLTDDLGQPLDGSYDLTFRIYRYQGGGSALWTEVHAAVPVDQGLFNVVLGETPFPSYLFNASQAWLSIAVGSDPELVPRMLFTSVPWAMRSTYADTALVGIGGGGADSDWTISGVNMVSGVTGNVGIGSSSPGRKLQVGNNTSSNAEGMIRLGSHSGNNGSNRLWDIGVPETDSDSGGVGYSFIIDDTQNETAAELMVKFGTGHVGIGTQAPLAPLHVVRPVDSTAEGTVQIQRYDNIGGMDRATTMTLDGGKIDVTGPFVNTPLNLNGTASGNVALAGGGGDVILGMGGGNVGIGTSSPDVKLDVVGTARVSILQISGADLAEKFPMSDQGEPGTVVVIDPDRAGSLRPSRTDYDTRVAGVISGAGGLSVGAVLGQCTPEKDAQPIAMSGRVWTWCDATASAIEPGDLLTTAGRPGHAMKATDPARSHGAVIGKAMTRLDRGETGLVLVLINLQ